MLSPPQHSKASPTQLETKATYHWHAVNIDGDPDLRQKYNEEVPVVFINNRKAFKYHMPPQQFLQALAARG